MEAGQTIDGYVFERLLGRGGMAEVWAARELEATELLALKILLPEFRNNEAIRQRFGREGQLMLPHPHIVPVLRTAHIDGRPTLVMPLYTGGSLESKIRPNSSEQDTGVGKPLPVSYALSVSKDILSALNFAHQHGTIHRDVKPANILLDEAGKAYLSDFGTATEMKRILVTRYAGGTPLWTSPEQIKNPHNVGHLADVYGFGCCLYDMLAGRPPFDADVDDDAAWAWAVQTKQVTEAPVSIQKWNSDVPAALDEIVLKSLAKKPEDRIAGCGEFGRLLETLDREEPAPNPDPAPVVRPRRKLGMALAAATGFLACVFALWPLVSTVRSTTSPTPNLAPRSTNPQATKAPDSKRDPTFSKVLPGVEVPTDPVPTGIHPNEKPRSVVTEQKNVLPGHKPQELPAKKSGYAGPAPAGDDDTIGPDLRTAVPPVPTQASTPLPPPQSTPLADTRVASEDQPAAKLAPTLPMPFGPKLPSPVPNSLPYSGPAEGDVQWSGNVEKNQIIEITGKDSPGVLSGAFPGVPIEIFLNTDQMALVSQPNPLNRFSRVVLRSTTKGRLVIVIHWRLLRR